MPWRVATHIKLNAGSINGVFVKDAERKWYPDPKAEFADRFAAYFYKKVNDLVDSSSIDENVYNG